MACQMRRKMVQHYWVITVKQQVEGFRTERHANSCDGSSFEGNNLSDAVTGAVQQSNCQAYHTAKRRGTTENIINKDRQSRWQPISVSSITWFSLVHKLEFAIFLETEYHRNLKPAKLH